MGIAENKQIVLDFYEAGGRGDMDGCFALLADDIAWTNIGTTKFSGTYFGKQALAENLLTGVRVAPRPGRRRQQRQRHTRQHEQSTSYHNHPPNLVRPCR